MGYYQHHVFFCCNQREPPEKCCAEAGAPAMQKYAKDRVKALGLHLARADRVQVSTNIEDLTTTTPGDVVRQVQRYAKVTEAELVAPAPRGAFESFPAEIPLTGAPLLA